MRRVGLCALVIAIAIAIALPARAQSHDKHSAAAHFKNGRALYADGSFAEALDEFQAGYQAYPLVGFLVNIGQCERKLGELDAARAAFQKFLDSDPPEELRGEVSDALAEVKSEIDRRDQAEAKRRSDEAAARQAMLDSIAKTPPPELTSHETPQAAPTLALASTPPPRIAHKKSRAWVWALVGVAAAGAVAAGVAVGVVETAAPQGSLGVIDGRR